MDPDQLQRTLEDPGNFQMYMTGLGSYEEDYRQSHGPGGNGRTKKKATSLSFLSVDQVNECKRKFERDDGVFWPTHIYRGHFKKAPDNKKLKEIEDEHGNKVEGIVLSSSVPTVPRCDEEGEEDI